MCSTLEQPPFDRPPHRLRMPKAMKSNEKTNPVNVDFLSRKREMMKANSLANLGEQARLGGFFMLVR